jgi:hypothetical protein
MIATKHDDKDNNRNKQTRENVCCGLGKCSPKACKLKAWLLARGTIGR